MIENKFDRVMEFCIKLKSHVPQSVFMQLPKVTFEFQINNEYRLAHFLGQCAHESANWQFVEENLNYSKEALMTVFRKYFKTEAIASQYARKPQKIANLVYSNRMGNGNETSGDGWKYRGRGYIQLTGKNNYTAFNRFVEDDVLSNPHSVATKYSLLSAGWYWNQHKLNYIADNGISVNDITAVTRIINGGTNGLNDRIHKTKSYFEKITKS